MTEHDDPEASYRRGYQQGAADTLKAFEKIRPKQRALMLLTRVGGDRPLRMALSRRS
jgi:hypothetical protein